MAALFIFGRNMAGPVAVDYQQAQNLASQQKQGFSDLLNQQQATSQGLFNQYTAASNAQPKLVDVLNTAQEKAGIGGLQDNINLFNTQASGVKGLIDRLNENTSARTAGTGANQAYLDRLRAVEGGGLNTQLSRLTSGLGDVTNAFNTSNANTGQLLSATQADQQTALHPLELQINSLSDQFARQITGFTTSSQNELDTLLTKLNNQQQLNNQEWARANALADQETQFQQARSLAAQSSAANNAFLNGGLTGGSGNPQQQQAQNQLTNMFKSNDVNRIAQEITAITKSAGYGNTGDQLKLQLLGQYKNTPYGNILNQAMGLVSNNRTLSNGGGNAGRA